MFISRHPSDINIVSASSVTYIKRLHLLQEMMDTPTQMRAYTFIGQAKPRSGIGPDLNY